MEQVVVTGAAGFIGSSLVDRLLETGVRVTGIDNLSTGKIRFLERAIQHPNFTFAEVDLLNFESILPLFSGVDAVFHLAANADVRGGVDDTHRDLRQNVLVTHNVLEAVRIAEVKRIAFSSTGSVYGEAEVFPTPENGPFPIQTSLYGASKLACEGLISAYSEAFGIKSWIFRFVSILGERYTHGHLFDFYMRLRLDPNRLEVLGNGKQRKSYLYVQDCIDAIFLAMSRSDQKVNIFNLGTDSFSEVNDSIAWISRELGVTPRLEYSGGDRGWIGDNPIILLDTNKIRSLGWKPSHTIEEGVLKTISYLKNNEWVFDQRGLE